MHNNQSLERSESEKTSTASRMQANSTKRRFSMVMGLVLFGLIIALVLGFTVLSTGTFASERSKETVFAGLPSAPSAPPFYEYSTGRSAIVNDEPYNATFFKNYGVNPFVDTADDHLSTFAMDVDTASYSIARRFIMDGFLPDPDSVRIEEFINYFDQGYTKPTEDTFAIHIDGSPSPFGLDDYSLMRVGIQGREISSVDRKDASLVFVIDTSGSMGDDNRIGLVKQSLNLLVDQLRPNDEIGIVVYGSEGRILLPAMSAENRGTILSAITKLGTGGSTNAEEGLQLGYQMASRMISPDRITRVILLSDGVANVGNTGPASILETIRGYVDEGVTLSTVGFGMGNYNDVLMEQLANDGNGNYSYVDTLSQAQRIFVENLTGTLQMIGKDAKIQVEFNTEVVSDYRLLGYENRRVDDEDFRNDDIDAGEVGAGHTVTALYELKFHEGAYGDVATVFVRYEDPDTHKQTEISNAFGTDELNESLENASPRFQLDAVVAEYAELLRESYWAREGTLEEVRHAAQRISVLLSDDPDVAEFMQLAEQATLIEAARTRRTNSD